MIHPSERSQLPSTCHPPRHAKRRKRQHVSHPPKQNQRPIRPGTGPLILHQRARDGNTHQCPEAGHEVRDPVRLAVVLDPAHPRHAHGRQADGRAGPEPEQRCERHDTHFVSIRGQPQPQNEGAAAQRRGTHGVEGADPVGHVAWENAAGDGARVKHGVEQEGRLQAQAAADRVGGDVRVGDEDGKLDEEDGENGDGELGVAQQAEVHIQLRVLVVRDALAEEDVGDEEEDQGDEGDDAHGPGETDARGEVLDDEGEADASQAAGRAG